MNTYRITCRETVYFVKEVKANSEDEANEKLFANVNGFKEVKEWTEEWEIAETELKEESSSISESKDKSSPETKEEVDLEESSYKRKITSDSKSSPKKVKTSSGTFKVSKS